jgi:NAD(P)H-dependent flavin oxidoreductase YrpB (nitropropane dioxygenase family)
MMQTLKAAWGMARTTEMTLGQTMMAGNAPIIIQKAMVEGKPAEGVLPSGQVAGIIDDLPSCEALIGAIIDEAQAHLKRVEG